MNCGLDLSEPVELLRKPTWKCRKLLFIPSFELLLWWWKLHRVMPWIFFFFNSFKSLPIHLCSHLRVCKSSVVSDLRKEINDHHFWPTIKYINLDRFEITLLAKFDILLSLAFSTNSFALLEVVSGVIWFGLVCFYRPFSLPHKNVGNGVSHLAKRLQNC